MQLGAHAVAILGSAHLVFFFFFLRFKNYEKNAFRQITWDLDVQSYRQAPLRVTLRCSLMPFSVFCGKCNVYGFLFWVFLFSLAVSSTTFFLLFLFCFVFLICELFFKLVSFFSYCDLLENSLKNFQFAWTLYPNRQTSENPVSFFLNS